MLAVIQVLLDDHNWGSFCIGKLKDHYGFKPRTPLHRLRELEPMHLVAVITAQNNNAQIHVFVSL